MKLKYLFYILCSCCLLLTSNFVFAQTSTSVSNESLSNTTQFAIFFTNLLSRIRIPIANLTGKMMSNALATGEVFGITDFLFKCRVILRSISNFLLVGIVFSIIGEIVKSGASKDIGKKVVNLILAGLFINFSRFMMGGLIDLANLTIFGISNIGTSIMHSNPTVMGNIALQTVCLPKKLEIDPNSTIFTKTIDPAECEKQNFEKSLDQIIPRYNDLSGPFMYFGLAVMRTFEFNDVRTASRDSGSAINSLKDISINLIFKIFMLFMFITPLFALLIMNAARILYIRIWFICSPLIILHFFFSDSSISWLKSLLSSGELDMWKSKGNFFDIKNIIGALMTPAITLATMFLSILIISTMYGSLAGGGVGISGNAEEIQNKSTNFRETLDTQGLSIDGRKISVGKEYSMDLQGDIIQDSTGLIAGGFGFIIMNIMMMGLLRSIYRVSLSTSTILAGIGNRVMDAGKRTITQGIKLPIGIGGADISLEQMNKQVLNMGKIEGMFKDNYIGPTVKNQKKLADAKSTKRMQNLGFNDVMNTYYGNSFNGKKYEGSNKQNFIQKTGDLFNSIITEVKDNSSEIRYGSGGRNTTIQSRVDQGGLKFLAEIDSGFRDELAKNNQFEIMKDDNGKQVSTGKIDYSALFTKSKRFGGFIKKVMNKKFIEEYKANPIFNAESFKAYTGGGEPFDKFSTNYQKL